MNSNFNRRRSISSDRRFAVYSICLLCLLLGAGLALDFRNSQLSREASVALASDYQPATPAGIYVSDAPVAAFIGDSYTAGSGASSKFRRWSSILSSDNNWIELNYGVGGTNYATGSRERNGRPFHDRLSDLVTSNPDIVIVASAGLNLGQDQKHGINKTFRTIRDELPEARIYAVSPFYWRDSYPERHEKFGEQIKEAVERVDGTYIDIGHPLGEDYPNLMAEDRRHPNDRGYEAIANAINSSLR